ncbi:Coenzyme PQQ synthesis protein E [uncultured archaeon]|nr:Coenzyme PQQ synthesis protein E [uncultured archaeon]
MTGIKLAGLALTALRSNFAQLKRPYKLTFAVTYKCQSRCLMCNIWKTKPENELTLQEIREFARKNTGFRWIELTGGEPFLRNDIVDIVKAFREACKGLYIITIPINSLCDSDMLERKIGQILDAGVPRLSITLSLDGYRELHDRLRGVPGNFDRVMNMARKLKEIQTRRKNLFFVFGYTMSKYNEGMLERTYESVRKELPHVTCDDFHVNLGQSSEMYYRNTDASINPERAEIAGELGWLIKKRRFQIGAIPLIEGVFLKKLVDYVSTGKLPMKSRCLDASLFIDNQGNVFPSIMWNRKIGNIRDSGGDLSKMWHGGEAESVRKDVREGREPTAWTACEAYQAIVGNVWSFFSR